MGLTGFDYYRPNSLRELEDLLVQHQGQAKLLAGGTDLMVQMKAGATPPQAVIDVGNLSEFQGIAYESGKGFTIMAGTKMATLEQSSLIGEKLPALQESVRLLGSSQVRFMASLGGNSCNASPSAETPPVLIALGASVTIAAKSSERSLPLESFFLGYRLVDLKLGEYLKSFFIPEQPAEAGSAYYCRMLRGAMEIDIVNAGVRITRDDKGNCREARIVLGSVAPIPLRAAGAEGALKGRPLGDETFQKAAELAAQEVSPIDDIRGSADYRREMVTVAVRRTLQAALSRIGK
jgi:carbon-monoxide dehydrogenase medium subunit